MAKATVEMICPTCGATYTWSTFKHNRKEADSWEAWASDQERECPECYRETLKKQRLAESERIVAEKTASNVFGIDLDTFDFKGTEKQNAWAKAILAKFIDELEKQAPTEEGLMVIPKLLRKLDARTLIDNRYNMLHWLECEFKKLEKEV